MFSRKHKNDIAVMLFTHGDTGKHLAILVDSFPGAEVEQVMQAKHYGDPLTAAQAKGFFPDWKISKKTYHYDKD